MERVAPKTTVILLGGMEEVEEVEVVPEVDVLMGVDVVLEVVVFAGVRNKTAAATAAITMITMTTTAAKIVEIDF